MQNSLRATLADARRDCSLAAAAHLPDSSWCAVHAFHDFVRSPLIRKPLPPLKPTTASVSRAPNSAATGSQATVGFQDIIGRGLLRAESSRPPPGALTGT